MLHKLLPYLFGVAALFNLVMSTGCATLHRPDAHRAPAAVVGQELTAPEVDWRPVATQEQCAAWDSSRRTARAVGIGSGVLAAACAAGGVLAVALDGSDGAKVGTAVCALAAEGSSAVTGWLVEDYTSAYVDRCTRPAPSVPSAQ